jgi:hypothetical protein
LTALQTILADNVSQAISPQDHRDQLVSSLGGYGAIYVADNATAQTGIGVTAVVVDAWDTNGPSADCTNDQANNKITAGVTATYLAFAQISFLGSASEPFTFEFFNNAVATGFHSEVDFPATALDQSLTIFGLFSVTAAQDVDLRVHASQAAQSITIKHGFFGLKRFR